MKTAILPATYMGRGLANAHQERALEQKYSRKIP